MKVTDKESTSILLDGLRAGPVVVTFTKKDGTVRRLRGTLNPCLIPEAHAPKGSTVIAEDTEPEHLAVYDLENGAWRSFRYETVISYE